MSHELFLKPCGSHRMNPLTTTCVTADMVAQGSVNVQKYQYNEKRNEINGIEAN